MSDDPILSTLSGTVRMMADLAQRPIEFLAALRRLGYQVDVGTVVDEVPAADEIAALVPQVADHIDELTDEFTFEELLAALELIGPVADVIDEIAHASFEIPGSDLDWTEIGEDVALRLPQMVAFDVIEHRAAWLVALLELVGLVARHVYELPATAEGVPETNTSVALDVSGIGDLLDDPAGFVAARFLTGDAIDTDRVGGLLALALGGLVTVRREAPDGDYIQAYLAGWLGTEPLMVTRVSPDHRAPAALRGIDVVIGPWRAAGSTEPADGLAIGIDVGDRSPDPIDVGLGSVTIDVPQPVVGLTVTPEGVIDLVADTVGDLRLAVALSPAEPWRLFGAADGPRLELGGVEVSTAYALDDGDVDLTLGLQALALRLDSEGTDSFMASLISGIDAEFDVDVTISRAGLRIGASAGLDVRLPVTITVGPLTISAITISAGLDDSAASPTFELAVVVDADVMIGPFEVGISDVGLRALQSSGGQADAFAFEVGLDLPDRVAFAFTGSDVVSGGGFLDIDHDAGRYSGGAALKIIEVGVSLLVVIDTQLPGGEDGWAFFGSLGIDIPGIPLGFGFTLEGVGGIIGLNRRVDTEALALGLKQGAADAIMFPDDPVRDAAVLIPQIDAYFPVEVGNTVIGPVIEIGWGAPLSLVTGQVGVMVSLPQGMVVILGSISIVLPDPAAPLIEINMDALGVIDLINGSVTVAASLYDSRLLGIYELSGDMAFHVATSPQPYFALAIGGWHPAFQPPSILPSTFSELGRIRAEISLTDAISITFTSYLAVTPNTVQFGGKFELEASVKVLLTTYTARGWFGFDVLLVFEPFKLVADVNAGVGVYSGKKELMGVSLGAHVEGPEPWFASGYARFKFFGVKVKFDFTVGAKTGGSTPPTTDLMPLLQAQLETDGAWEVTRGSGIAAGVVLAALEGGGDDLAPLLADGTLSVRQTAAPLEREIEVYGTNRAAQTRIDVARADLEDATTGIALGGVASGSVEDWFAPAQYDAMSDTDKLSAASYELSRSGASFGADAAVVGADEQADVPVGHETTLWEAPATPADLPTVQSLGRLKSGPVADGWFDLAATTARRTRRPTVQVPTITVAPVVRTTATTVQEAP